MDITFGQKIVVRDSSLLDMLREEYYLVGLDIKEESTLVRAGDKRMIVPVEKWFKENYGNNEQEKRVIERNNARVEQECSDHDSPIHDFQLRYHKGIAYIKAPDIVFGIVGKAPVAGYITLSQVVWTRRKSSEDYPQGTRRRENLFERPLNIDKDSIESLIIYAKFQKYDFIS